MTRLTSAAQALMFIIMAAAVSVAVKLTTWPGGPPLNGDYSFDADPALQLAAAGHLLDMYSTSPPPLMLPFALLVRIPEIAVANLIGSPEMQLRYTIGTVGGLALCATIVFWVSGADWRSRWRAALLPLAVIAVGWMAILWGHPEEVFGALLVVAALVAIVNERWRAAAICAGLAAATKQTFWLALPALLLAVPRSAWRQAIPWGVISAAAAAVPWVVMHLGTLISQNASVGTHNGKSGYTINAFSAFGINDFNSLNKPLILAVAVIIPLLIARRTNYTLTAAQAAATLGIVFIARCVLDPFNIHYYMVVAMAMVVAMDFIKWRAGRGWIKTPVFIPVAGGAAAWLLMAATTGPLSQLTDTALGDTHGKDYVLMTVAACFCLLPAALARKVEITRRRGALYGCGLTAAVAVIALAGNVGGVSEQQLRVRPPSGFADATVAEALDAAGATPVYWVQSPQELGMSLRMFAARDDDDRDKSAVVVIDYGQGESAESVTLFARRANAELSSALHDELRRCRRDACSDHVRSVSTPAGPAIVKMTTDGRAWEATVDTGDETSLYINANLASDPDAYLQRLTRVTARTKLPAGGDAG